ncbi:Fc.00g053450.m01.CDS01 [Cosmosporella sp. VM-42]
MAPAEPLLPLRKKSNTKQDAQSEKGGLQQPPTTPKVTPRKAILTVFFILLCLSWLDKPLTHCHGGIPKEGHGLKTVEDRARQILSTTPLIDGHVDFPILLRVFYGNHIYYDNFTKPFEQGELPGHVDLKRLRDGQSGGAFWSLFAPCPSNGSDFADENYASSVQWTYDQIDLMTRLQVEYPHDFSPVVDSSNALEAFKQGQLISPFGVEGLHQIGNRASNLRKYYDLGVRYATLTHNCHNKFADAAILENPSRKAEPLWGGVSPLGRRLIDEMNRIGMFVDISHVSEDTMVDVLGGGSDWSGSQAPVIFSHSSAFSVCPHPRNVKDHVLQLVKERDSLVMVNIAPDFISCVDEGNKNGIPTPVPANATLAQVVNHILHIGNLIGFDHVGIGSDFDGIPTVPKGLEDVSKYPDLVAELLRQGVSDADASKVVGGNLLRVWKEVDAVAADLQAKGTLPMEDDLPQIKFEETIG